MRKRNVMDHGIESSASTILISSKTCDSKHMTVLGQKNIQKSNQNERSYPGKILSNENKHNFRN